MFNLAREKKPTVVFVDEIDSLCTSRDVCYETYKTYCQGGSGSNGQRQVLNEFLVQMDGVGKNQDGVLVLGATNVVCHLLELRYSHFQPWELDSAIRRRFQKRIYIPLPDEVARRCMFGIHFGKEGHQLTSDDFDYLAKQTEGYSGSDISNMVKQALMIPIKRLQKAKYFVVGMDKKFHPCEENATGAIRLNLYEIPKGLIDVPVFTRVCI